VRLVGLCLGTVGLGAQLIMLFLSGARPLLGVGRCLIYPLLLWDTQCYYANTRFLAARDRASRGLTIRTAVHQRRNQTTPDYIPTTKGTIDWTVTIADVDPDVDMATATTVVK
jgi:hypothetical protein